jgi:beta-lactamase class A
MDGASLEIMFRKATIAVVLALLPLGACQAEEPATAPTTRTSTTTSAPTTIRLDEDFGRLETQFDARLGVYAVDTGSGQVIEHRADDRFPFCSTFKALAAGALLARIEPADLDRELAYTSADIVANSPIAEQHLNEGSMSIRETIDAAVRYSDNTAANLMFVELGGPAGLEQDMRAIGDQVTEMERIETDLSEGVPGDIRDTSTPRAMAANLAKYVLGDVLPTDDRALLTDLLRRNTTGDAVIRAGVPADWVVGDKTGTGGYGVRNDIAVLWPPNRAPIVLAVLTSRDKKDAEHDDKLIAEAAKTVVTALGA